MSARPEHFLDHADPGGPTSTELEAQRKRRLDSGCCEKCGRPASVAKFTKAEAELQCGCGWSRTVVVMSRAYQTARLFVELRGTR